MCTWRIQPFVCGSGGGLHLPYGHAIFVGRAQPANCVRVALDARGAEMTMNPEI
jgi:hypothetical protein